MKSQCSCGLALCLAGENCPGWHMPHVSRWHQGCMMWHVTFPLGHHQQYSSYPPLLPLMASGSCSEKPTDRNCIGLPGISHLFSKQTIDVHWVNPNVWMSRSSCEQESRRHGGIQWGRWAIFTEYCWLWVWRQEGREATLLHLHLLYLHLWNWQKQTHSWNCPLPPAADQHPLFHLQKYVSLSSKCSWDLWTPLWALTNSLGFVECMALQCSSELHLTDRYFIMVCTIQLLPELCLSSGL